LNLGSKLVNRLLEILDKHFLEILEHLRLPLSDFNFVYRALRLDWSWLLSFFRDLQLSLLKVLLYSDKIGGLDLQNVFERLVFRNGNFGQSDHLVFVLLAGGRK